MMKSFLNCELALDWVHRTVTSDSVSLPCPAPLRAPTPLSPITPPPPPPWSRPGLLPAVASPPLRSGPAAWTTHRPPRQRPRPARASGEGTGQVLGRREPPTPRGGTPGPGASRPPSRGAPTSGARWHRGGWGGGAEEGKRVVGWAVSGRFVQGQRVRLLLPAPRASHPPRLGCSG
ncbi:uncharacterized protein LOC131495901 [Neofelis nebulosa]|uniref:uncharacterized protein LOC131495901 n=1 Tax=Neofelis nebulosa TaxID=61452 RepID=UPI00272AE562|nr:uncharacterized protein LOC131495901 [Neofelis nebulosa]